MSFTAILSTNAGVANIVAGSTQRPTFNKPQRNHAVRRPLALPIDSPAVLDSTVSPAAIAAASSVAAIAAAISLSDPDRRRKQQAENVGGGDKEVVREYFNNTGFERWRKIYGNATDGVNKVQLDIRLGHAQTVENAIKMLRDGGKLDGITICDAGCGTGSLSIPLAREGAVVYASDISAAMVEEARRQAEATLDGVEGAKLPQFEVKDLEGLEGKFHTVVCLDVLIHYPKEKAEDMIGHLASLAEERLVLSFAPRTWYYDLLKRVGEFFPGSSKATRAYLHSKNDVEQALKRFGWKVSKRGFIATQFYFANLIEAVPIG